MTKLNHILPHNKFPRNSADKNYYPHNKNLDELNYKSVLEI